MPIANSITLEDNSYGTLASGLAVGDTTLNWTSGHGARFPAVAAGQCLSCCILNANNTLEEVIVTLHTAGADSATIVRAQNSTTAKAWNAGDRVEARITGDVLARLQQEALKATTLSTGDSGATYTGTMSPAHLGYVSGMVYAMDAATSNSGTGPTINLNSLGAVTVKLNGGAVLGVGHMPPRGLYSYDGTNFILLNPTRGPVLMTEQASTSGTAINFTGIPAGTRRVTVMFDGVSTNGTNHWLIQLGDAGGLETSGYVAVSGIVTNTPGATGTISRTDGFPVYSSDAGFTFSGSVTFSLEDSTNNTWVAQGCLAETVNGHIDTIAGRKATSAVLDRVTITTIGGTDAFDAGAINISYE